jgi:hypothetical protein
VKNRIRDLSIFLNDKIISLCENREFEKYSSFYAESFALSSLDTSSKLDEGTELYLTNLLNDKDRIGEDFHFEFNNYALITNQKLKKKFEELVFPLKFRGTECTSWTLLRERVLFEDDSSRELDSVYEKITTRQMESGLVVDEPWDKSFQYHCFSIAMIGEIYEITKDVNLLESFEKGVDFITPFISPTGETTFVGRGQSQSFGYSSLLYILVLGEKILNRGFGKHIELVVSLIENQIEKFKDLPLVINRFIEKPYEVEINNPNYCGWYPYNNHIDYFCFSSYFISKTSLLFLNSRENLIEIDKELESDDFIVKNKKYFSVVSNVGGYWVNDLPVPYIQYQGESILPLYGGDQFHSDLYQFGDVPIPINKLIGMSIRKRCQARLINECLILKSFLGNFKREFEFKDNSIVLINSFLMPFMFKTPYYFLAGSEVHTDKSIRYKNVEFIFSKPFTQCKNTYSVSGEILKFEIEGNHSLEINFL